VRSIDDLVAQGLPGMQIKRRDLAKQLPQAWKFWRSGDSDWAIFPIVREYISKSDHDGANHARTCCVNPVFVAQDYNAIKALSSTYRQLRPYVICEIAGRGHLISPPVLPRRSRVPANNSPTRVPSELLRALASEKTAPEPLASALKRLQKQYRSFQRRRANSDQREEVVLLQYAERMLEQMGLRPNPIKAAQMIRTLERGGLGARRDHFFHSFQNYFLGLRAILQLRPQFEEYKHRAKLDWSVEPSNVWFLAAMWHDVGYPFQRVGDLVNSALGYDTEDDVAIRIKETFLQRSETREALRTLGSLLAHLLDFGHARTQWMKPGPKANLGQRATQIQDALSENLRTSHGAFGAVRLFCDYSDDFDNMQPETRDVLLQTVYLASCSIPFHDWYFRRNVRNSCGDCRIGTTVLPFAALLAFVDSIQDDRRGFSASEDAALVLKRLLITKPATITADINRQALSDRDLLDKIIEGRDVLASLEQTEDALYFKYPKWIAE